MAPGLETSMAVLNRAAAAIGAVAANVGSRIPRAVIAVRLRRVVRTLQHRREAQILAGLDDHMLADMGVNRADLRDAFSEPMWRDPTRMLAGRVQDRRVHSRRRAMPPSDPPRPCPNVSGFVRPAPESRPRPLP